VQEIAEIRTVNDTGKQQYLMMEVWWVYQFLLNNPTEPNNVSDWASFSKNHYKRIKSYYRVQSPCIGDLTLRKTVMLYTHIQGAVLLKNLQFQLYSFPSSFLSFLITPAAC